jgi:ProP effector
MNLNTRPGPGQASSTSEKEKPGNKPGSRSENTEAQYIRLPRYKPAAQLLALLREQHTIFRDYLPLPIGIHRAIGAAYPEFGKTAIRRALQFHAHSLAYLKNLAAGGYRYDFRGEPLGLITSEHQQQAQEKLIERRQASKKERPASKPTPRGREVTNTAPVETGDAAGPDAVVLRLKEMRPRLTLKRKEVRP